MEGQYTQTLQDATGSMNTQQVQLMGNKLIEDNTEVLGDSRVSMVEILKD